MHVGCRLAMALVIAAAMLSSPGAQTSRMTKAVSFALLEDYDKNDDLAEVERDFALFKELEIRTWRGSFGWDDYEPARGRFDFGWLRKFTELAGKHGIELRPYLGYTPEWAARPGGQDADIWNNPPRDLDRFARFAQAVARELRAYPHVRSYEIYNEENVTQWWDADASTYARLLARAGRAVRRGDRDSQVLFGGLVFPDADWVEAVCGTRGVGEVFDVLPFHAYPETWTPAGVTVENYLGGLDDFLDVADQTCGRKSIWINETGFATVPGTTERAQANWWVRAIATFLAHPRIEHIGIYEIKDLPAGKPVIGDAPNYHLGLVRSDRTKKMAFATIDILTDLLDAGTLTVLTGHTSLSLGEGSGTVFHHLFERPDGTRVLIIWTRGGPREVTITFDEMRPTTGAIEYFEDGRTSPLEGNYTGRTLHIKLRDQAHIFKLPR